METTDDADLDRLYAHKLYAIKKRNQRADDARSVRVILEALNLKITDMELERELTNMREAVSEASYGEF